MNAERSGFGFVIVNSLPIKMKRTVYNFRSRATGRRAIEGDALAAGIDDVQMPYGLRLCATVGPA